MVCHTVLIGETALPNVPDQSVYVRRKELEKESYYWSLHQHSVHLDNHIP